MAQGQSINQLLAMSGTPAQSLQSPSSTHMPEANMFAGNTIPAQAGYGQGGTVQPVQQMPTYSSQTPGMMAGPIRARHAGFNDGGYQQTPTTSSNEAYARRDTDLLQRDSKNYFEDGGAKSASIPQDQELPPYDLLYSLVDLYFKHINTWCPILHRKSTFDALFGPSSLDEADRLLLHA